MSCQALSNCLLQKRLRPSGSFVLLSANRHQDPGWLPGLENHREAIAAMDFFTVPTVTFRGSCSSYERPFPTTPHLGYLILDRDRKYAGEATEALQSMNSELIRASYQSPWQNGVAERWVGSCRRELRDQVMVFNEAQLRGLVR